VSALSEKLSRAADEFQAGAIAILDSPDFARDAKLQAQAIIGGVKAGIYQVGSELAAELGRLGSSQEADRLTTHLKASEEARSRLQKENHALRMSAAVAAGGDSEPFNRVVRSLVDNALRDAGIPVEDGAPAGGGAA